MPTLRPAFWGSLYLLMIPGFAVCYYVLPGDNFYHSTVHLESGLEGDAESILDEVRDVVVRNFRAAHGGDAVRRFGWEMDVSRDLHFFSLEASADAITFEMGLAGREQRAGRETQSGGQFFFSYNPKERGPTTDASGRTIYRLLDDGSINGFVRYPRDGETPEDASFRRVVPLLAFPRPPGEIVFMALVLPLPRELDERLRGFWRAKQGLPAAVSQGLGRCLYLSAVTITTVGYGDIVPISAPARFLVAAEAVLGVVVIGLFLNALVSQRP